MTTGDFDFFGAPTTPPPTGPGLPATPVGSQFGTPAAAPAVNQFGLPILPGATNQFGLPVGAPTRPSAPTAAANHRSENARQLLMLGGTIAAVVLAVLGYMWAQSAGQKTATSVDHSLDKGLIDAHNAEETADLRNASQLEETYLAEHNAYATTTAELTAAGLVTSKTSQITVVSATGTTFCLRADDTSGRAPAPLYLSSAADVSTTPCT